MELEQLIARIREQINARIGMHNDYVGDLTTLRAAEVVDDAKVEEIRAKKAAVHAEIETLRGRLAELEAEKERDAAVGRLQSEIGPSGAPPAAGSRAHDQLARIGQDRRTYDAEADPHGYGFLTDVVRAHRGDPRAWERLARHMDEERVERSGALERAVTTSGAPGLVIPQYLVDLYAPKGRPGRKFADQCRKHVLPETGMTVYIPRQTAKTAAGEQANQLDTVAESDYDDELISVAVRTAAGSQTISRQSSERSLGTEDIVFEDLLKSYDTELDSMLINSASWGLLAVANAVTYTDGSPTAAELYVKVLGAGANVEDVLEDLDEDELFTLMRGRRWAWLNSETTDQKPFIQQARVPAEAFGTNDGAKYAAGVRGFLPNGGRVVTDNNLPKNLGAGTNEDVVVVVAEREAHLWEDPSAPLYIRAEQPQAKKLAIDLVVYGYFAACFNRVVDEQGTPKAVHQKITGTGLVAPAF